MLSLDEKDVKIMALGGLGEIGKNTYLICTLNHIIIVDAGIMFPDDNLRGVDYIIPDYTFLKEHESQIIGLFITHGHEDHIGGIKYLLDQVKIKNIYSAGIASKLIKPKIAECRQQPPIINYNSTSIFNFGEITISFVGLNHSIPDSFGIKIETPYCTVFHTGDFKIDNTPVGPLAEFNKLVALSEVENLILLSDSTNAEVTNSSPSESRIGLSIIDFFQRIEGRIFIVTFSSNIYRIQQTIDAAERAKRHLLVLGASMENAVSAGLEANYLTVKKDTLITMGDLSGLSYTDATKLVILCTGSQGEKKAALNKIVEDRIRDVKIDGNDTIIFSSSAIPGNQGNINNTINALYKKGAKVILNSSSVDTHTSGHATQNDLKLLFNLVKPHYFIPIHGEYRMLLKHRDLAIECGVLPSNTLVIDNGDVVSVNDERLLLLDEKVPAHNVNIDGKGVGDVGSRVLSERKRLSKEGIVIVTLTFSSSRKRIILEPDIISRGFVYMKGSKQLIMTLRDYVVQQASGLYANYDPINDLHLRTTLEDLISKKINEEISRNPKVIVCAVDYDHMTLLNRDKIVKEA